MGLLATWLDHAADACAAAPALIHAGTTLTYRQLCDRAQTRVDGRGPSTIPASGAMIDLALHAYGASFRHRPLLPLNPALSSERRDALLKLASAPSAGVELCIATSGTEGEAKAVMLSGDNLQASVQASLSRLPLGRGDVWLNCLPLHHIGGMAILFRCAAAEAAVLLHEGFAPAQVWADLEKYRVTHLSLVPAMLARLLEASREGPPPAALKHVLVGGGPLSATLARRARLAGWPLCVSYGMSETGSQLATLSPLPDDWQPGQVGVPLPGFEVELLNEEGRPAAGVGRIRVRGAAVMAGYANSLGQPGLGLEQGWFTSGDLGSVDAQGRLTVLGRHDDMLVSGGVNIHPQAVEEVLKRCPGVEDAALTAVADEVWGDLLVAVVVGDCSAMASWCREQLPSAQRPRRFAAIPTLPRNALGKLERRALRNWVQQNLN